MSLDLKHIPCPAGAGCTAFQCIFGHGARDAPIDPPPAAAGISKERSALSTSPDPEQGARKRVKLAHEPAVKRVPVPNLSKGEQGPQSATRPVSPPPLKRQKNSLHSPSASASSSSSSSSSPKTFPTSAPSRPAAKPAVTTKKPENLNPRLLKSAPAKHEIRYKLLSLLHQELTRLNSELKKDANDEEQKLVLTPQDLITRALDMEENLAVTKAAVYSNVMKNLVMQYKRMGAAQWKDERSKEKKAADDAGVVGQNLDIPREIVTGLTPDQEVELLQRILTPVDQLAKHGYVSKIPSEEDIEKARQGVDAAKGWEKCDRCQQRFQVFPGRREEDGALTSGGSCNFHWGKTYYTAKTPGDRTQHHPKRYLCCGQEVGDSAGCFTREHHVFKTTDPKRLALVLNFAETPKNPLPPANRAVCFDCEMGYTVYGLELIRLTATAWPTGEELLDVLVRPVGEILDLNSRFSGVWPDDLAQAEPWSADGPTNPAPASKESGSEDGELRSTKKRLKIVSSPEVARDLLFSLLSPTTPLIGHGLENDLNAVRIIHPSTIDTVLLYPHKAGLPYRYGLKWLMQVHLNRKIQQETGPKMLGHDSAEDARAAGELVRLRIMDTWKDMQRQGWTIQKGVITPPPDKVGGTGRLTENFLES